MMTFRKSPRIQSKSEKLLIAAHQCDAVFHEESEYVICFKIWQRNHRLKSFLLHGTAFTRVKKSKITIFCIQEIYPKEALKFLKIGIKMITKNSSTNRESFIEFGWGHRIDLVRFRGFTQLHCVLSQLYALLFDLW